MNSNPGIFTYSKRIQYFQLLIVALILLVFSSNSQAARIYNFTDNGVLVCPGAGVFGAVVNLSGCIGVVPAGHKSPYKRSASLDWKGINGVKVVNQDKQTICTLDFGFHAQIQGGNYMKIDKHSCKVFNAHHKEIEHGSVLSYPLARVINHSMHTAEGTVKYASVLCKDDRYTVGPAKMVKGKLLPTTWVANSRGVCLIDGITSTLSNKKPVVDYESSGTSYSHFEIRPTQSGYRIFSAEEYKRHIDTQLDKSPGFYIENKTDWPIAISLKQAGCLYYDVVDAGKVFKRDTGAVWFTITANIQPDGKLPETDWDCIKPVAEITGAVLVAAATGGYGAFTVAAAEGATASTAVLAGAAGVAALKELTESSIDIIGELINDNGNLTLAGQYAGYEWPFRCDKMPKYQITGGPTLEFDNNGKATLGKGKTFTLKKMNTCGRYMMKNWKATAPDNMNWDATIAEVYKK